MNWKKNRGASKLSSLIMFLVFGYFVYQMLGENFSGKTVSNKQAPAQTIEKTLKPSNAFRSVDNSWPAINRNQAGGSMSNNTLTENYYIVLDGSGSMEDKKCSGNTSKMTAATRALSGFVKKIPAQANVGLAIFIDSKIYELAPLQPAEKLDVDRLVTGRKPAGSTPLFSAIQFAYSKLNEQGQKQLGYGRYHLIVITDGIASKNQDPSSIVDEMIEKTPINLHTIGFCIGADHVLNQPGRLVYHAADNPQQLSKGLGSVLAESPHFDLSEFKD